MNKKTDSIPDMDNLVSTGIEGLDNILYGGLPENHVYIIEGAPGAGKTTLGMQFILEGIKKGEVVLYVSLTETQKDLESSAKSHGWDISQVNFLELLLDMDGDNYEITSMYHPSEIDLGETMKKITEEVERIKPKRFVLDALTEIRLQSQTQLRYRRELLSLCTLLSKHQCTALFLDELREESVAKSVVHGFIELYSKTSYYGPKKRRLQIEKLRGKKYLEGYHDFIIQTGGLEVFPQLRADVYKNGKELIYFSSGIKEFDLLLGYGISKGTTTLLVGPSGSGKSSLATQFVITALKDNKKAAIFLFDETRTSFLSRSNGIGMNLDYYLEQEQIILRQIDPGELTPGQFTKIIREIIDDFGAEILVLDSLNGFHYAMPDENYLLVVLHELSTYLNQKQILTFYVMNQFGLIGSTDSPIDISYLTDNVILLRMFEANSEVRKAISVVKKRTGTHERTIREMLISSKGIEIGQPLWGFQGVLTGNPQFTGHKKDLLEEGKEE